MWPFYTFSGWLSDPSKRWNGDLQWIRDQSFSWFLFWMTWVREDLGSNSKRALPGKTLTNIHFQWLVQMYFPIEMTWSRPEFQGWKSTRWFQVQPSFNWVWACLCSRHLDFRSWRRRFCQSGGFQIAGRLELRRNSDLPSFFPYILGNGVGKKHQPGLDFSSKVGKVRNDSNDSNDITSLSFVAMAWSWKVPFPLWWCICKVPPCGIRFAGGEGMDLATSAENSESFQNGPICSRLWI